MKSKFFSRAARFATGSLILTLGSAFGQTIIDWTPGTAIPDNNPVGIVDNQIITFNPRAVITGLEVRLHLTGTWNGDLYVSLVHDAGFTVLLNRPGNTTSNPGGSASEGMNVTFKDDAALDIHTGIPNSGFVTGTWQPDARTADPLLVTDLSSRSAFLSSFNESPVQGNWTLFLADNAAADTTTLTGWGLTIFSEDRDFAIWDANGSAAGIGGAGTWSSSSSTWATSNVGTSTSEHDTYAQLFFRGTGGEVTVSGTVNPAAGMDFQSDGYTLTGGTINLAGASASANELKVATGVSATIGSTLAGENGMTKAGTGKLVLTGTNTYGGETVVNAGNLVVGVNGVGSITSNVTVASGATLSGTGTISGTNTIQDGGIYAPGNSIGIQTANNITFEANSIFEWEMNYAAGNAGGRGVNYDAVVVTGQIGGPGNAVFRIVLPGSTSFDDSFWLGSYVWTDIFTGADASISTWASRFGSFSYFNADGLVDAPDAITQGSFTLTGSSLTWTAIPEPGTALAGLLLAAGLLRRRRA